MKRVIVSSRNLLVASTLLAGVGAFAQMPFQVLKSFGDPNLNGAEPHAALIQGADGALYGTTQFGGNANAGTVFRLSSDGNDFTPLHTFSASPDGSRPYGRLVQGGDGVLYGTTIFGGSNNLGTVFKINTNGNNYGVLRHFSTNAYNGQNPHNALLAGSDGALYGTTTAGGTNGVGTVFRLNVDGTGYLLLHSFSSSLGVDGASPGELVQAVDAALYGITQKGSKNSSANAGTLFKINTNGAGYTVLTNLSSPAADGRSRHAGLIQGSDGAFYGTVFSGGTNPYGAVFKIDSSGSNYIVLHSFTTGTSDGQYPDSRLVQGTNGTLFGTTTQGGTNGNGTVFELNTNGTSFAVLYSFGNFSGDGQWPSDTLLQASDGALYGTTLFGGADNEGTAFKINADGSGYAVLRSFAGIAGDGPLPKGRLVRGADGAFYGTTAGGGSCGAGTVFRFDPTNNLYTVLHDFTGTNGDGQLPLGGLLQGGDGALYGASSGGGANGSGTVFKLDVDGNSYAVLYNFSPIPDGNLPSGTLAQGTNGVIYGVTGAGGSNDVGTVFTISTNGSNYTILHHFTTNAADGWGPVGGLALGTDGSIYGTTADGGSNGGGTIFEVSPDGSQYTTLHHFRTNGIDGTTPFAGLVRGSDGAFYGTTRHGGGTNMGTVFRINADGSGYAVLRSFNCLAGDAQEPLGELTRDNGGVLFGTSSYGGGNTAITNDDDRGTVFQIGTNGFDYAVLQSFSKSADSNGRNPSAGLAQGIDGSLYGTTESGADLNAGTIFKLGLGPPQILADPQDQTVWLGGSAVFNVTAVGGGLNYQWLLNGAPWTNTVSPILTLNGVVRGNGGRYSVQVTNLVSGALSSNALLTVQVPPLSLTAPTILADGSFQLGAIYSNGWLPQAEDLALAEVQFSPDLTNWSTLSNSLVLSNGWLRLQDSGNTNQAMGFYRILEH